MSEKYWDRQLETLPIERRRLLQDHRLRWQVRRCWDGSPFYRARLEAAGIDPATFGGLTDIQRMPIFHLSELPAGHTPVHPSPEWTVAPLNWWQGPEVLPNTLARALTGGDELHRADVAARWLWAAGGRPGLHVAVARPLDNGPASDGIVGGAARFDLTLQMASKDPGAIDGPVIVPNIEAIVAYACREADGVHWADDHFLIETVDPVTSQPAEKGAVGAVVITDLTREGSPLLRYWTDLEANLFEEPCACGRTAARSTVIRLLVGG